jgi:hypothetical protein
MNLSRAHRRVWGLAALAAAAMSPATPVVAAPDEARAAAASPSPTPSVHVDGERVTVDVNNEELLDVLTVLAEQAGFRLTTDADLGRVTAAFTVGSVEQALRRLVHDHELMLVYSPSHGRPGGTLTQVEVFASPTSPEASRRVAGGDAAQRSAALSEIAAAVRTQAVWALRNVQGARSSAPISGVLRGDPDARVRRTAARTLGALGTPEAIEALRTSSEDPDALVRREVDRALRRADASPSR